MIIVPQSRLDLLTEMEERYEKKDTQYFVKLLDDDDYVIRCRATCILVDLGGEDKVQYIAKVLKNDTNELVRHEAAFSLDRCATAAAFCHWKTQQKMTLACLYDMRQLLHWVLLVPSLPGKLLRWHLMILMNQ